MSEYLPYLIFGLTAGAIYGISAMGLVLTYKTSGVFNVAHGAMSAVGAYIFYELRQEQGLPWPVAAVIAVLIFGPLSGLLFERLAAALAGVTVTYKIVATVGVFVCIQAGVGLIYGPQSTFVFETFLPQDEAFAVDNVSVTYDNLADMAFGLALAVGLFLFFTRTRAGLNMRGVVDDPSLLDMTGASPARVRRNAWMIGSTLTAVSGVLFASTQQQLDINVLSLLVVQAFGAAALARFTSLPMAFVGGIVVGVLQKLVAKEVATYPDLQGLDLNVPFIILFITLLVVPRHKLVEVGRPIKMRPLPPSPFSKRSRMTTYGVIAAVSLMVPHFAGAHLIAWTQAASQVVLFLSLGLLVRTSGQISLCHVAFAAIGAAGFGHSLDGGLPWGVAVLIGGLVVIPVAAFIAIPAIRLSGLYLGLATLGFGIFVAQFGYTKNFMFGIGSLDTQRPAGWESDTRFYYLLLGIAVAAIGLVVLIESSRLGRLLRGLGDSPTGLVTLGLNVNMSRVIVFCISGFLAGISGATFASLFGSVSQESFGYFQSLLLLAVLAISGRRLVTSAIVGPILLFVVPNYIDDAKLNYLLQFGFGLFAILAAAASQGGVAALIGRLNVRSRHKLNGPTQDRIEMVRARKAAAVPEAAREKVGV
ncbi:ABC transporter permease [Sporichthya polymorpha]|uniref:branched-chain amino acid ABC transporter permease n=1 Tax=Sporichthya polymorpha TaxID=35751 RepID=UPI001FE181B1|nr:ABC transporter permease [Sporichthya polymorpha]